MCVCVCVVCHCRGSCHCQLMAPSPVLYESLCTFIIPQLCPCHDELFSAVGHNTHTHRHTLYLLQVEMVIYLTNRQQLNSNL